MTTRFDVSVLLLSCLAGAASCSTSSIGPVQGAIGPAGGTLSDDGTTVTIPAGALSSVVTITLTPTPDALGPVGVTLVGTPMVLGPEGQKFAIPVSILMKFDPARLPAESSSSSVSIYTAALGSGTFTALPTTAVDATHVSAQTTHFSIFDPGASSPASTAGTTGGTSSGTTSGGGLPDGGEAGATSGGTTGGTMTGLPDAGAGLTGGTTGGSSGSGSSTGAGGTTGGTVADGGPATCSATNDCVGLGGCMALTITSKSDGNAACNNPFLNAISTGASFVNGGWFWPAAIPPGPSLEVFFDSWSVQVLLPCCPASTGTMSVNAVLNRDQGGAFCDGDPMGGGTIDFEEVYDGGMSGTISLSALGGVNAAFSFPSTLEPGFCDAGQPNLPPSTEDAGTAACSAALDCLGPDAGTLSGTGSFWLNPSNGPSGTWCEGPLDDLSSSTSISTSNDSFYPGPMLTVGYDSDFWEIDAYLPCCPAGPGMMTASSINLQSMNGCGEGAGVLNGSGTVTFTQTDGGLAGSIHLDGSPEADATFSLP